MVWRSSLLAVIVGPLTGVSDQNVSHARGQDIAYLEIGLVPGLSINIIHV